MFDLQCLICLVTNLSGPSVHGGAEGGGLIAALDSLLEALSGGLGGGSSWQPASGLASLGSNVHPMMVHFPIAFIVGFFILEPLGLLRRDILLRRIASAMLYLGAAAAVIAVASGLIAGSIVPHGDEVHQLLIWHQRLGITTATLASGLALFRAFGGMPQTPMTHGLHLFVSALLALTLAFGTDLGGLMVYRHGLGVKSLQPTHTEHSHGQKDARGGTPHGH